MGFLTGLRKYIGGDRFQNGLIMAQAALAGDHDAMARMREAQRLLGQRRAAEKEEAIAGSEFLEPQYDEPPALAPIHLPEPNFGDENSDASSFNPWAPFAGGGFRRSRDR